jgi:hypothetical protein
MGNPSPPAKVATASSSILPLAAMPRKRTQSAGQDADLLFTEREIWTGALGMIERHGAHAVSEARMQLRVFVSEDELDAQLSLLRIIEAIVWLQDDRPPPPRRQH